MKFIITSLVALAMVVGLGATSSQAYASGYINQADVDITQKAYDDISEFNAAFSNANSTQAQVQSAATTAETSLDAIINHSFSTKLGSDYVAKTDEVKKTAKSLKTAMQAVVASAFTEGSATYTADLATYNQAVDSFDAAVKNVDTAVETSNSQSGIMYLMTLIGTVVLTIGALIWSRQGVTGNADLARAKKQVFLASLWPLGGAVITYGTYFFADALGGSYFIAWGLILIGFIAFIKSVIEYAKVSKSLKTSNVSNGPFVPPTPSV